MRFAIILLVVLTLACAGGSFIPQGQTLSWYAAQYSERTAGLILALGLDDVFHSWWFLLLTAFLCGNLLLCNLLRLKPLLERTKLAGEYRETEQPTVSLTLDSEPETVFSKLSMPKPQETTDSSGRRVLFSTKNRIGNWGAWVCHLGILLLIIGFTLGQMTHREYTVYGVAGQTKPIGDTGLLLTIEDFEVALREDDTVEQYRADISVTDGSRVENSSVRVNEPADLFGMRFYQNSTGWAAKVTVEKNGEAIQESLLCAGEFVPVEDRPELVVLFNAFYPDYVMRPGEGPATLSGQLNNPGYLYSLYYNEEILGMNVLTGDEAITVDDYTIRFSDPQSYTLLQIKQDHFTLLALLGGVVVLIGLFIAFYLQPKKLWAVETGDGWSVCGVCRKGGSLFREQLLEACGIKDP